MARAIKRWNSLPRDVAEALSYESFKNSLDKALEKILLGPILHWQGDGLDELIGTVHLWFLCLMDKERNRELFWKILAIFLK